MNFNLKQNPWLGYGIVAGAAIAVYLMYKDYQNRQQVQALKTTELTAAGSPPVVTPTSVASTTSASFMQSFVKQPGELGFVKQPSELDFMKHKRKRNLHYVESAGDLGFVDQPMLD